MKNISKIQSAPSYIAKNKGEMRTVEEKYNDDYESFRTDASVTVISAMSTFVEGLAIKIADMVSLSSKIEWRAKYGIISDYSAQPNTLSVVSSIRKAVNRHTQEITSIISLLHSASGTIRCCSELSSDAANDFISRIDNADIEFADEYENIRRKIIEIFRDVKCSDPKMFYPIINAIYMAGRFSCMARYIAGFAQGFEKGGFLSGLLRLNVIDPLITLAHRLNLTDKQGHPLHFIFTIEERAEYAKLSSKRSFHIKHASNPPVVVDVYERFKSDDLTRLSWKLETHMMELRTIDKIIASSDGNDPQYRNCYSQKRLQSCANTFEQAMVNQTIHLHKWHDLPQRMRSYLDSINNRRSIDHRRTPKPVVCFQLCQLTDKKGKPIIDANGKPDYYSKFIGIWNSSYEAQNEWGTPWKNIRKSVELKAVNDGFNNVWLSLDDYLSMTYDSLLKTKPDIASEFLRIIPELSIRSTKQIASETTAKQAHLTIH